MAGTVHIGTSGWQYRHWIGDFYPAKTPVSKMREEYVKHFDTVELNSSFYHQPPRTTFENWRKKTPRGFLFAVKANRFITHNKKLHDAKESLDYFMSAAKGLGKKLGPILFQLPPSWQINLERLEEFLKLLPKKQESTFEFRHKSWMTEETYKLLKKYNAAFCIYELAGIETPHEITADFAYVRLHGPSSRKYSGDYSRLEMRLWAKEINGWQKKLKNIYVYFDNDVGGFAPKNALTLRVLI
jgi:uncharacterized protein YecE (DUF72 family)